MALPPYISQVEAGALGQHNDCGAACALMLLRHYGRADNGLTVDALYREMRTSGDTYLGAGQIVAAFLRRGVVAEWRTGMPAPAPAPLIALIWRAPLVAAGQSEPGLSFGGAHWVVVVGARDGWVCVHDPYWHASGGAARWLPPDVWAAAWERVPQGDAPAVVRGAVVVAAVEPGADRRLVVVASALRVRSGPGTAYNQVGTVYGGDVLPLYEVVAHSAREAWARIGSGRWVAMRYNGVEHAREVLHGKN